MKRILGTLLFLTCWGWGAGAATLPPINTPVFRAFDSNGQPLVGGKLYSYAAGSSTPLATYSDAGGTAPNTNPVVLDGSGSAKIFMASAAYKFVLQDANGVQQWTVDNISGAPPASAVSSVFGRMGAVVAVTGDYTCGQVTGAVCSTPTLYYQTIGYNGTSVFVSRNRLNLVGGTNTTVNCVDNAPTTSTDCTIAWVPPTVSTDQWFEFDTCTIAQTGNIYNCAGTFSGSPFPLTTNNILVSCQAMTPGPVSGFLTVTGGSLSASGFTYAWTQVMGNGTSGAAVGAHMMCYLHFKS